MEGWDAAGVGRFLGRPAAKRHSPLLPPRVVGAFAAAGVDGPALLAMDDAALEALGVQGPDARAALLARVKAVAWMQRERGTSATGSSTGKSAPQDAAA